MSLSIMQRVLEVISKKIDNIATRVEPKFTVEYNNHCLECHGTNLNVTKVHRGKEHWVRYLICKDCKARNKQVLNIIDYESGEGSYTHIFKPNMYTQFTVTDGIVEVQDSIIHTFFKSEKSNGNFIKKHFQKMLLKQMHSIIQKKYDAGEYAKYRGTYKAISSRDVNTVETTPWMMLLIKAFISDIEDPKGRDLIATSLVNVVWKKDSKCETYTVFYKKSILKYK